MRYIILLAILLYVATNYGGEAETRIRVAVIDTGLNVSIANIKYLCKNGQRGIRGENPFYDGNGHGTNVVSLIIEQHIDAKKYCIAMIKYCSSDCINSGTTETESLAIDYAVETSAKFINLSLSGENSNGYERASLARAVNAHINISIAAGNENKDLDKGCNVYPACWFSNTSNIHVVGSNTFKYKPYSNYGRIVRYWEDGTDKGIPKMTGTSQATAIHTGKWINQ